MKETIFKGKKVTESEILNAMKMFDSELRSTYKKWRLYAVEHNAKRYPPKEILSQATSIATTQFTGGEQTNRCFRDLGFKVVRLEESREQVCLPEEDAVEVSLDREMKQTTFKGKKVTEAKKFQSDERFDEKKENQIRDRLLEHGEALFRAPKQMIQFTKNPDADALLNDLSGHPHAFVLACIMDRQIKAEKAWLIPYRISEKLDGFSFEALQRLSRDDVLHLMKEPEPLHRFVDQMSGLFYAGVQRLARQYAGDAARIWAGRPSSSEVLFRFLEFKGIGPKIGSMATNILAREFKIPFSDYHSIDISADVHVCRVFSRLGLCAEGASVEQVINKARSLYPKFPGMMDLPCWEIGRNWCKPQGPECGGCYMRDLCPSARSGMS
jgi:endonuclease III